MLIISKNYYSYGGVKLQQQLNVSKNSFNGIKKIITSKISPEVIKNNNAKFLVPLIALMSCFGLSCLKNKTVKQNYSINEKDIFIKNNTILTKTNIEANPSLEKFKLSRYKYADIDEYIAKHSLMRKELHARRMKAYGTTEDLPVPSEVKKSQYQAMFDIQYETGEYFAVMDKLRKGLPLNKAEQRFFDAILKAMEPTTSKRTLWRSIGFYDGLEEQIRKGKIVEKAFSSTASKYSDFYDFWRSEKIKSNNNGIEVLDGCMLKINITENTPILDCNAIYKPCFGKPQYTRMRGEVVLPPGEFIIKGYDPKLKILEVDFVLKV